MKVAPLDTPMKASLLSSFKTMQRPPSSRAQSTHPSVMSAFQASGNGISGLPVQSGRGLPGQANSSFPQQGKPQNQQQQQQPATPRQGLRHVQSSSSIGSPQTPPARGPNPQHYQQQQYQGQNQSHYQPPQRQYQPKTSRPSTPTSESKGTTKIVEKSKFIMVTGTPKRHTIDGLNMPPILPGDEDLYSAGDKRNGSVKSNSNSDTPRGKRSSGMSFDASSISSAFSGGSSAGHENNGILKNQKKRNSIFGGVIGGSKAKDKDGKNQNHMDSKDGSREKTVRGERGEKPESWARWFVREDTFKMEVERVKKLRMLLRHESTEWVSVCLTDFVQRFLSLIEI